MIVVALAALSAAWLLTRSDPLADGIAAFRAGRLGIAEGHLQEVVERDSANVTALLYLGRIRRTQGRFAEARRSLEAAARTDRNDAAVQRELGYLFLDLGAPSFAVNRFRLAQELDPAAVAGWVGLVRALRAAGDPSADEVLARAPPEARALLTRP
jgi:cytochrome c-type biogenesis protein CcmH/NrfG